MKHRWIKRFRPLVIVLLVSSPVAAGCADDEPTLEEGTVTGEAGATIDDEEYGLYEANEFDELENAAVLGRTVTVSANVKRVVEPDKTFVTGAINVANNLLVVITPKVKDAPSLSAGDDVLVVGKVIRFARTDIESAYEPFDLDDDLYGDYDDAHAILAQTIIKPPAAGSG